MNHTSQPHQHDTAQTADDFHQQVQSFIESLDGPLRSDDLGEHVDLVMAELNQLCDDARAADLRDSLVAQVRQRLSGWAVEFANHAAGIGDIFTTVPPADTDGN